jgi:hypothetical protein
MATYENIGGNLPLEYEKYQGLDIDLSNLTI